MDRYKCTNTFCVIPLGHNMDNEFGEVRFIQPTAAQLQGVEQRYAKAREMVEEIVDALVKDIPTIAEGTGMSDASVLFQYIYSFIIHQHRTLGLAAVRATEEGFAAALTILARNRHAPTDNMTEFEREVSEDDHRDCKD
jgi:hypothetical protein